MPRLVNDDFHLACTLGVLPHRFVACVVTEELNAANLHTVMMDAATRTRCAHERYVAVWRVSSDINEMSKIISMSQTLGIGVIHICRE